MDRQIAVTARNTHSDSPNLIHSEQAREHGFDGALVPGISLCAYMFNLGISEWGASWLSSGYIEACFRRPVYDGELINLIGDVDEDTTLDLRIENRHGDICVTGRAGLPELFTIRDRRSSGTAIKSRLGTSESLMRDLLDGASIPEYRLDTSIAANIKYLNEVGLPVFTANDMLHPGLICATTAVFPFMDAYVWNGPLVHTAMRCSFFAEVAVGTPLTAFGKLDRLWKHKNNDYVQISLWVLDHHDNVVAYVESESIYQLG